MPAFLHWAPMPLQMAEALSNPSATTVDSMFLAVTHIGVSRTAGIVTAVSLPGVALWSMLPLAKAAGRAKPALR